MAADQMTQVQKDWLLAEAEQSRHVVNGLKALSPEQVERTLPLFFRACKPGARTLGVDEFQQLLTKVGAKRDTGYTPRDIKKHFQVADADDNGVIDFNEFCHYLFMAAQDPELTWATSQKRERRRKLELRSAAQDAEDTAKRNKERFASPPPQSPRAAASTSPPKAAAVDILGKDKDASAAFAKLSMGGKWRMAAAAVKEEEKKRTPQPGGKNFKKAVEEAKREQRRKERTQDVRIGLDRQSIMKYY